MQDWDDGGRIRFAFGCRQHGWTSSRMKVRRPERIRNTRFCLFYSDIGEIASSQQYAAVQGIVAARTGGAGTDAVVPDRGAERGSVPAVL